MQVEEVKLTSWEVKGDVLEVELTVGDQEHRHKACQHYRLNPVGKQSRNKK